MAKCILTRLSSAIKHESTTLWSAEFVFSRLTSWQQNLNEPPPLSPPNLTHSSFLGSDVVSLPCQVREPKRVKNNCSTLCSISNSAYQTQANMEPLFQSILSKALHGHHRTKMTQTVCLFQIHITKNITLHTFMVQLLKVLEDKNSGAITQLKWWRLCYALPVFFSYSLHQFSRHSHVSHTVFTSSPSLTFRSKVEIPLLCPQGKLLHLLIWEP